MHNKKYNVCLWNLVHGTSYFTFYKVYIYVFQTKSKKNNDVIFIQNKVKSNFLLKTDEHISQRLFHLQSNQTKNWERKTKSQMKWIQDKWKKK